MLLQFVKDSYLILCFMQMSMHILQVAFDTVRTAIFINDQHAY